MNHEKVKEVFSDKEFVMSLLELNTVAEVQSALKEKDIDFSEEEILAMRDILAKAENDEAFFEQLAAFAESGELSEEMLEQVAGGGVLLCVLGGALAVTIFAAVKTSLMMLLE